MSAENNLTHSQIYYKNNKDYILNNACEKTCCECGAVISRASFSSHRRSKRHKLYLLNISKINQQLGNHQ